MSTFIRINDEFDIQINDGEVIAVSRYNATIERVDIGDSRYTLWLAMMDALAEGHEKIQQLQAQLANETRPSVRLEAGLAHSPVPSSEPSTFIGFANDEDQFGTHLDRFLDWVDDNGEFMAGDKVGKDIYDRKRREYDAVIAKKKAAGV